MDSLEALAQRIPSMGGHKLSGLLREAAAGAPSGTSIVEVGCWLGAGTAQLALGILDREDRTGVHLHCYDRWEANAAEVAKAAEANVHFSAGDDTLPLVDKFLQPFGVPISYHKGDILKATWNDGPISVYVDDAAKKPFLFNHMLKTFGPHWIPRKTILVLMDYSIWKKTALREHGWQMEFMESHQRHFEPVRRRGVAVFRYVRSLDFEQAICDSGLTNLLKKSGKILVMVLPHLGMGGAQRVALSLAKHWVKQGIDVTIVTTMENKADFYKIDPAIRRIILRKTSGPKTAVNSYDQIPAANLTARSAHLGFELLIRARRQLRRSNGDASKRRRRFITLRTIQLQTRANISRIKYQWQKFIASALHVLRNLSDVPQNSWLLQLAEGLELKVTTTLNRFFVALVWERNPRIATTLAILNKYSDIPKASLLLQVLRSHSVEKSGLPRLRALPGKYPRLGRLVTEGASTLVSLAEVPRTSLLFHFITQPSTDPDALVRFRNKHPRGLRLAPASKIASFALRHPAVALFVVARSFIKQSARKPMVSRGLRLGKVMKRLRFDRVTKKASKASQKAKKKGERLSRSIGKHLILLCLKYPVLGNSRYAHSLLLEKWSWRVAALRGVLAEAKPDIVISLLSITNMITVTASRGLNHRLVISERNDPTRQKLEMPWRRLRPILYPAADIICANTVDALNAMRAFCPETKLQYVPNPLIFPKNTADHSSNKIVYLGRLVHQKAPDVLVEAFAEFAEAVPGWGLHIAGDGPMFAQVKQRVGELKIERRVVMHGFVRDPSFLLAQCAIFVLPSRFEGTPNALLEAMAYGTSCVVSDASPGPLDLIEHEISGLVVKVGCAQSLALALTRLARDGALRLRLGLAAVARVEEFRLERVAPVWERMFDAPADQASWQQHGLG